MEKGVLEPVCLELPREALVNPGMLLRVSSFSGVRQKIQKVGYCNRPPCLRNRFFPKSVHPALGVLGVPNVVAIDLEELDARDGWILESSIYRQGRTYAGPLPVHPLLSHILSSAVSHGFLRSFEIPQESSSGGRREIFHEPCNWGWTTDMGVINLVSDK